MYLKGPSSDSVKIASCTECGKRGHSKEKCWSLIGYPKWHNKNKSVQSQRSNSARGPVKIAHNVQTVNEEDADNVTLTSKQLEQLLKMLPSVGVYAHTRSQDMSDIDSPFSGMVSCNTVQVHTNEWIVDSGATDHMTYSLSLLTNVKVSSSQCTIKLPTGVIASITHVGEVVLKNGLKLKGVLYVPTFNHNL